MKKLKLNRKAQVLGWQGLFLTIAITLSLFVVFLVGIPYELAVPYSSRAYTNQTIPQYFNGENITQVAYSTSITLWNNATSIGSGSWVYGSPPNQVGLKWWQDSPLWEHRNEIQIAHITDVIPYLNIVWGAHNLFYSNNPQNQFLDKDACVSRWDSSKGYSYINWRCDHFNLFMFITPYNQTYDIGSSWEYGRLQVGIGLSINFTTSGIGVWTLLGQILTFQSPQLGLGNNIAGYIFSSIVAIPFWFGIAFVIYKFIVGLIPFVSGGS